MSIFITGTGRTKFGALPQSLPELAYEAMCKAVKDSGIWIDEVDAIFVSNFLGGPLNGQLHLNSVIASLLPGMNIPIVRIETACASSSVAFNQAIQALQSNAEYQHVMVVGAEKMTGGTGLGQTDAIAMAGDRYADQRQGLIFPANYALIAQQYMRRYGVGHDVLAQVAYINHRNARLNPLAHFSHKDVTMEMIAGSPVIATPLNLFDCSPISDGAAAIVLSRRSRSHRDVRVLASRFVTDATSLTQRADFTSFKAARLAAGRAYDDAGLKPKDIDVLEVHDCFTIGELLALEDMGFCEPGAARRLIQDGSVLRDGMIPVNLDGGLKGDGHPIGATGLAQIHEIVCQLRGEAGPRQVSGAKVGATHNIGGIGGTAAVTILGRC